MGGVDGGCFRGGGHRREMPERCFCWFNSNSSPLNRGVSIFSVRECVHMPGIALLSVSMCESAGRRGVEGA